MDKKDDLTQLLVCSRNAKTQKLLCVFNLVEHRTCFPQGLPTSLTLGKCVHCRQNKSSTRDLMCGLCASVQTQIQSSDQESVYASSKCHTYLGMCVCPALCTRIKATCVTKHRSPSSRTKNTLLQNIISITVITTTYRQWSMLQVSIGFRWMHKLKMILTHTQLAYVTPHGRRTRRWFTTRTRIWDLGNGLCL